MAPRLSHEQALVDEVIILSSIHLTVLRKILPRFEHGPVALDRLKCMNLEGFHIHPGIQRGELV